MADRSAESSGSRRLLGRVASREVAALSLAGLLLLLVTPTSLAVTGDLTQPAGTAGCVSEFEREPCADGHGLPGPTSVAVSPDKKSVYVASFDGLPSDGDDSAVARFSRNPRTGAITQPTGAAGCVSESGKGPCADGHALGGASSVAVSPDGKNVYVASINSTAVARLNRNTTTGAISQPAGAAGCVSETGAGPCADGHALDAPWSVTVSPDGQSVYVTSLFGAVARLNRNTTTGAISQPAGAAGCIHETGAGGCADGHGLAFPNGVAVSPDSKSVYVAAGDGLVRLNRNTTTGAISQPAGTAGCVSEEGAGPCANGHAIDGAFSVAVSPDGRSVYVASENSDAVARFYRNTTTGAISQPPDFSGCISESGAGNCRDGHGLNGAQSVVVSPDGKSVYAASDESSAVARFSRAAGGGITQPAGTTGCVSEDGTGTCANGHGLEGGGPWAVAVARGGKSVYAATGRAVARFNRAP
jgi:DNA-binding beta-propeller fold protein YncE